MLVSYIYIVSRESLRRRPRRRGALSGISGSGWEIVDGKVNRMITIKFLPFYGQPEDDALLLLLAALARVRRRALRRVAGARHVGQAALAAVPTVEVVRHEGARAALRVRAHRPA